MPVELFPSKKEQRYGLDLIVDLDIISTTLQITNHTSVKWHRTSTFEVICNSKSKFLAI